MVNHLHLAGSLVVVAVVFALGGVGLVLHELFADSPSTLTPPDNAPDEATTEDEPQAVV